MAWPSGSKAGTTSTDNASDSISGARADINQNITNVNSIIDLFDIGTPGASEDNKILVFDNSTGKFEVEANSAGAVTDYTNGTDNRLVTSSGSTTINGEANFTFDGNRAVLAGTHNGLTGSLKIESGATNAFNGAQLTMTDNTDDVFSMVGRVNTGAKAYNYAIITDPNGNHKNTSAFTGDYGFYFNMDYEAGGGGTDWYMLQNVFGADDGYYINSFASNHLSYARTPIILGGSKIELIGYNGGTAGGAFQVEHDHVDLNGLYLKDTSGTLQILDVFDVTITSGGTTSMNTHNKSATALGNRVTVGDASTAHTSGDGFLVRRGTGSGFEEQLKVETDSSTTKVTARGLQLTGATVDSTTSGFTQTNRLTININGTDYYIALDAV